MRGRPRMAPVSIRWTMPTEPMVLVARIGPKTAPGTSVTPSSA
ncbi:hypothetical protein [Streptomyces endocoffeicus]|nr:hypothetical protein [Streptomyces endocoffeicus]